jgi:CheY-like chemotaxis protein
LPHVLVVHGDPTVQELCRALLEGDDHEVTVAADASVVDAGDHDPMLAVIQAGMLPEVAQQLVAAFPKTPIVALADSAAEVPAARAAGAVDCLVGPVHPLLLTAAVADALAGWEGEQAR